jgi:NADH-quinone oxidoreductase subunit A
MSWYFDFSIFIAYLVIGLTLSFILLGLSFILSPKAPNKEKLSAYECGFEPFEDARIKFNIHYYIIAILFIVFDAEILFLFPWTVGFSLNFWYSYPLILFFLIILTLGFILE